MRCRDQLLLAACVVAWYASSALCTAAGKMTLTHLKAHGGNCALSLTLLQFLVSAIVSGIACVVLGRSAPSARRELLLVSFSYTIGFLLLNCSLGRLQASFSETVRGLEPLTSYLIAWLLAARGTKLTGASAVALGAVLLGAAVSVWAQPAFDPSGLVYGLLANCAFSSRGILVTLLQDATRRKVEAEGGNGVAERGGVDPIGLFAAQHALGLLLIPTVLGSEGTRCMAALAYGRPQDDGRLTAGASAGGFLAYNFLSLYVLLLIDAVSHSVCNTCRRAVTIVAAAVVFQNQVSLASASGIALIISGAIGYAVASAASRRSANGAGRDVPPIPSSSPRARTTEGDALLQGSGDEKGLTIP
jgi:hypothetical protein